MNLNQHICSLPDRKPIFCGTAIPRSHKRVQHAMQSRDTLIRELDLILDKHLKPYSVLPQLLLDMFRKTAIPHCSPLKCFIYLAHSTYASLSTPYAAGKRLMFCSMLPLFRKNCTYAPSIKTRPSCFNLMYSSRLNGVKPQFLLTMIFCLPGNLYIDRRKASMAVARWRSRVRTERRI